MNADVKQLLNALERGDPHAASRLLPLVYEELCKLAGQPMAQEQPGQALQPHQWPGSPATAAWALLLVAFERR
jgi:hypothetical protein